MLPALFTKAVTAAVTGSAASLGKVAGVKLGQSLFSSDSAGKSTGASLVSAGADAQQILLDDKVPDFPKLTAEGFLNPVDYRRVGADTVPTDRTIGNIIDKMMTEPVFTADAKAAFIASQVSTKEVPSNSSSRKFAKYVKGLG
jgi:hypothetical protein